MGTLVVRLRSKESLISSGILQKVDENTEDTIGTTEYYTEVVGYRIRDDIETVTLKHFVKDDETFDGTIWKTGGGLYIHKDWIEDFSVSDKYISYKGENYTMLLNKSKVKICRSCNCTTTNEHGYCDNCFKDNFSYVNNYSHKPSPIFYGEQLDNDKENPVWYGIELEHSSRSRMNVANFSYKYNQDRFYFKSDASIHNSEFPVEMVTHPHSFKELMSCDWLNNLHELDVVDNEQTHEKNGCHIHVSSTAFTDNNHYAKWYFFVYSLANGILQRIANRELTRYCQNTKYDNIITKTLDPKSSYSREVIINERNINTKEVRVFSTTTNPKVLKSYIQFLESTIKYSKYAKKSVCYDDYIAYIFKYNTKYQELIDVVNGIDATKKPRAIVVPTETGEADSIFDVPSQYLHLITWVYMSDGNDHKVQSLTVDFISENIRLNGSTFSFDNIRGIKYEY
ncbi:MAG: hypothetical protein PHH29_17120 [Desulfuromonadaceae bacterium]|nr:hypothetical protein [Desulfuromonadaceae bacterium]